MLGIMGAEVVATGFLGRAASLFIQDQLHKRNVTTNFVHINNVTRHNYFIIDEFTDTRTLLDEEGPIIEPDELDFFLDNFQRMIKRVKLLIIAGSIPRGVENNIYCRLIEIANEYGVRSIINTQEHNLVGCLSKNPYIVMPDTRDSDSIFGQKIDPLLDRKTAACKILGQRKGASVLTFDYENYLLFSPEGCWEVISPPAEIRSKLKTGDGMIAGMAYSLVNNPSLLEAAKWGVALSTAASCYRCRFIESKEEVVSFYEKVIVKSV